MKEEMKKALRKAVEMGWITLNSNVNEEALINLFAAHTLNLSFQDFKNWYLR